MTNRDRSDRLLSEALAIAEEMRSAVGRGYWNLAARRAQEVVEIVVKGLLSEMGVDSPRTHDASPVLVETIRSRRLQTDPEFLSWLGKVSGHLAEIRAPAFYHEMEVSELEARGASDAAERVLAFGREFLERLQGRSG